MGENASTAMYVEINGNKRPLEVGQLYLFGKHLPTKDCDNKIIFNIDDEDVDEKHCCVEVSVSEELYVFDLFSTGGTFVNGERLKPLDKACVNHGDVMKLGKQSVRFVYHEQFEMSQNSSGFGDNNKNTSDIIASSPETTTQKEARLKRFNSHSNDNFLVPAVPPPPKTASSRASTSFTVPETEDLSTSRRSSLGLNASQNKSRLSDSFTIPETQQLCRGRASTASNLSIVESIPDDDRTQSGISFDVSGGDEDDDDDFCIPETQEVMMNREKPRSLEKESKLTTNGLKTLEEKSVDLNDSDEDNDSLGGSQFRICTQDYNEGFGEEDNEAMMHSHVIPLIKHTTVLLNGSSVRQTPLKAPQLAETSSRKSAVQEEDKEIANINWSTDKAADEEVKNLTNCSTPDLFEFEAVERARTSAANDGGNGANLFEPDPPTLEDEEDYMPTQVFPASNNSKPSDKDKTPKEKEIFSGKEDEPFLTLSDKENMHPDRLEPITDLPPTQLFATHEGASERSLASTSSRKSNSSKSEANQNETLTAVFVAPPTPTPKKDCNVLTSVANDEEDDILTQAFIQPPPKSTATSSKTLTHNYFNSTLLDDRAVDKNPASFFAEMETTPKKVQSGAEVVNVFKVPEKGLSSLKKSLSAASTTSSSNDSDMDLLMCTPQLIKEHMQFSKADELRKHILAAKNKKLFGEDTDEGEDLDDDRKSKDTCLVELINVPKDSKDFDKLLPHLKHGSDNRLKKKSSLTEEQKAAKEACKEYKFNISFGQDQQKDRKANSAGTNSTVSRDDRHAARDKEKDTSELREAHQKINRSNNDEKPRNSTRKTKHEEADKKESKSTAARKTRDRDTDKKHDCSQSDEKQANNSGTSKQGETQAKCTTAPKTRGKEEQETSGKLGRPARRKDEPAPSKQESPKESKDERKEPTKQQQRHTRAAQEKGTAKKAEPGVKTNGEQIEGTFSKKDSQKKLKENEERPARRRTRQQSADKPKNDTNDTIIKLPARRTTRLKSAAEEKEKTHPSKDSVAASDELDLIPTQPMIRSTRARTRSRSVQKDPNESYETTSNASSSVASHSSSRTLNRSSSRLNTSQTALVKESNTTKTTAVTSTERKRKSDIPMPQQNTERKRLKRTTSQDCTNSSATSSASRSTTAAATRRLISITMVDPEKFHELSAKSNGLWAVAKDPKDSEALVMDKSFRTFKFLLAMARGIPIVTSQWIRDINMAKSLKNAPAPTSKYIFSDPDFEKKHKFSLEKSLQLARDKKNGGILHGHEFVMTKNIKPSPAELKVIIEIAGGTVHVKGPPPAKNNQTIYLISSQDDRKDWHKFRRLNTNIVIVATEAIMSAVMRQNCSPLSNHVLA